MTVTLRPSTTGVADHLLLLNIGVNSHAAIDTHIADATIHYADAPADGSSYVRNNNAWVLSPMGITDHTGLTSIGVNTHAQLDTHLADATIHFTVASISHTAIADIGTNTHAQLDTHVADATIHFTEGSIDHTAISNIGVNSHAVIDSALTTLALHIGDATIHFTEASIDHTAITNIGTNSHAAIDTHIGTANIHFADAPADAQDYVRNNNAWAVASAGVTDHTLLTNIGTNTHAAIDTHIADATIHFTEASIDHTAISNIGTNTHVQLDTHLSTGNIHFTEASIDHTAITNIGTNSHAAIDTHIGTANIHYVDAPADAQDYVRNNNAWVVASAGGVTDHTLLTNIGTNTHAQIDTHIADATIHFTEASIDHTAISNIGTNTHAQLDTHLADATIHFTEASIDHTAITNIGTNSHAAIDTHIADATLHFTEGSISHLNIADIGTNSHATIDTHIADATIHFTVASISHTAIADIGTNSHAAIDTHIADATLHFTEASIDHTAISNIGTNSHATIDTHIADATIHFTEASIDHTAITNIGTNSHAAIDTHIADATIHFTEASIDHGSIAGLADDDHLQYLLLAGRAGGQTAFGGTAASEILSLQGSTNANRGTLAFNGNITLDYDWTTDVGTNAFTWAQTIPASGAVVASMFLIQNTVTVNAGTFILSAIRDLSALRWTTSPGFAVSTLFFAQSRYYSTSAGVAPAQAFIYAAQPQFESFGAGAITCNGFRGLSASPILRARNAGDNLTMVNTYGMTFQFLWNTNNATAIVDAGNAAAVKVLNPQVILFGASTGTERCTNYYGIDYDNINIATTGERAVVHSSLVVGASNFFLKNDGGAASEFGAGVIHHNDSGAIQFGNLLNNSDVSLFWNGAGSFFEMFFWSTSDFLEWSSPGANRFLLEANDFGVSEVNYSEINFAFDRFAFGQSGAVGNQVGIFVAPARTAGLAGGWSDFVLTQAGNLDLGALAMSDVSAWVINQISLDAGTGSIAELATLTVGGMTTSNPGITVTERSSIRSQGRLKQSGTVQYPPVTPAALSAGDNDDWAGLLTATASNSTRRWARISGNATTSVITGIDATAVQDGDTFELTNVGSEPVDLSPQDAGSAAANRIITPSGNILTIQEDETVTIRYDDTDSRWRIMDQEEPEATAGLITGVWRFDTATGAADPGAGRFRYDNATPASVTNVYVDQFTRPGTDAQNFLSALASGDQLYIQQADDASRFLVFDITSVTDNTGWFTIGGTVNASGSLPVNNRDLQVSAIFA